ncbi:hypothetical protein [Pseudomonas sp. UBA6310]|uniref:hypothetical protein n=1 Tax=Pseudomonas sp. UBA6310 TaxID=1947327 RepID=UPI00257E7AB0|nr:hypothetical protein [Pseudomonas sp. UBA6310]
MSFDVILIKPNDLSIEDLSSVEDVMQLGDKEFVEAAIGLSFPGAVNSLWQSKEFSIEALINGNPVESVHITAHFGDAWTEASEAKLISLITVICHETGAVAFSISDNSKLAP